MGSGKSEAGFCSTILQSVGVGQLSVWLCRPHGPGQESKMAWVVVPSVSDGLGLMSKMLFEILLNVKRLYSTALQSIGVKS